MNVIQFDVIETDLNQRGIDYKDKLYGTIRPVLEWDLTANNQNQE